MSIDLQTYIADRLEQGASEEDLIAAMQRTELVQDEINRRIWAGELEVTDGDSVVSMRDLR